MMSRWFVVGALLLFPSTVGAHTIYVNFDGGYLSPGGESSQANATSLPGCSGDFPAFGDAGMERAAILQATRTDWAAYDVAITDQRPASDSYTMVMVGAKTGCCGNGGIAPLICGADNLNAIAYSCQGAGGIVGATAQAGIISQEAAHTFGLMHVNDTGEIMNPTITPTSDPSFKDACYAYSPGACAGQKVHCPGNQQNSHQELLALFGPAKIDTMPPEVWIVSPENEEHFEPGVDLEIEVQAQDDEVVSEVELIVNDEAYDPLTTPPFSWRAENLKAGVYEIQAVAFDAAGNAGESKIVRVVVGQVDGGGNGDAGDDDSGDGNDGAGPFGPDAPPSGVSEERDVQGCGCTSGSRAAGAPCALLVLASLRRRRRAHAGCVPERGHRGARGYFA